jgi:hypothetical protein
VDYTAASGIIISIQIKSIAGVGVTTAARTFFTDSGGNLLPATGQTMVLVPRNSTIEVNAPVYGLQGVTLAVPNGPGPYDLISLAHVVLQPIPFGNPMTGTGDLIGGSPGGIPVRIAGFTGPGTGFLGETNGNPATFQLPTLANDSDVSISSPATNQALVWNGTKWTNQNQAGGGGSPGGSNGNLQRNNNGILGGISGANSSDGVHTTFSLDDLIVNNILTTGGPLSVIDPNAVGNGATAISVLDPTGLRGLSIAAILGTTASQDTIVLSTGTSTGNETLDAAGNVTAASFNGSGAGLTAIPESAVTGLVSGLAAKAPLASPALTGNPTAPTQTASDNSTLIATDAFVKAQNYITSSGAPVQSVFGRTGTVTAQSGDYTVSEITGAAPLASPALTGTPTAPTPSTSDNSTKIATTAYVKAQGGGGGSSLTVNSTTISGGTPGLIPFDNSGTFGEATGFSYSATHQQVTMNGADAATNTPLNVLTVGHNTSGTPTASFGANILFNLDDSASPNQNAAIVGAGWEVATDGSQKSYGVLQALNPSQVLQDVVRWTISSGNTAQLTFNGSGSASRPNITFGGPVTDANNYFGITGETSARSIGFVDSGVGQLRAISGSQISIHSGMNIGWSSGDPYAANNDTGFERISAGLIGVDNGSAGTYMDFQLRTLVSTGFTFSGLPSSPVAGSVTYCTNCKNVADDSVVTGAVASGSGHGSMVCYLNGSWRTM